MTTDKNLSDNNLAATLFGKTRRQILSLLYANPAERFYLRQLTTVAGVAVGAAQRELAELTSAHIIRREVEGRQVYFRADSSCPIFEELRSILAKTTGATPQGTVAQLDPAAPAARMAAQAIAPRPVLPRTPPRNPAFVWM